MSYAKRCAVHRPPPTLVPAYYSPRPFFAMVNLPVFLTLFIFL